MDPSLLFTNLWFLFVGLKSIFRHHGMSAHAICPVFSNFRPSSPHGTPLEGWDWGCCDSFPPLGCRHTCFACFATSALPSAGHGPLAQSQFPMKMADMRWLKI